VNGLNNLNRPLYAGRLCKAHDCDFTSGSFTVLNRESAALLLEQRSLIPVHVMDDVGFGTAFKKLGILPVNLDSLDFDSLEKLTNTSPEELSQVGHFRLKSGPLSSRGDVEIMRGLLSKIEGN
jgi:hypothetical protein